jgi:hypothetical protein
MNEKELRQLINEVTAEIIAEADSDMDGMSDADELRAIADDMDGQRGIDDQEVQNSRDAISANEVEGKLSFDEWVLENGGEEAFGPNDNAYDKWLAYVNPGSYDDDNDDWYEQRHMDDQDLGLDPKQALLDKHFSADAEGGAFTDDEDELLSNYMQESKSFTFDKFMKDINSREDKIEQHKIELTENDGDTNARLKQKLYQEDWRNSVKFKENK